MDFFQVRKNMYMYFKIELKMKSGAFFFLAQKIDEVKVKIT